MNVIRGNDMVIWFNSDKARKQLTEKGVVVTCRTSRKQFGITTAIYKNKDGNSVVINEVNVKKLCDSISNSGRHMALFNSYVDVSGFDTVEEWRNEVKKLNRRKIIPEYLIFLRVKMVEWDHEWLY